jgi:putative hydrolase of the HAD superfamily
MNHPAAFIVFDMDDTLYLERDFVHSGYRTICNALCQQGLLPDAETGFAWLWDRFEQGRAANAFNALSDHFQLDLSNEAISDLVTLYRTHDADIHLCPEGQALLAELAARPEVRLALITDGPVEMQESKFYALGLDAPELDIAPAVFTARLGADAGKPSPIAYKLIQDCASELQSERFVYIADNLKKDFLAPNLLGWHSICLQQVGQVHSKFHAPEGGQPSQIADSLNEVRSLLLTWLSDFA